LKIYLESPFYFNNINTGYVKSNASGQVLIGQNVTGLGNFVTSFTLNTSAGDYSQQVSINGLAVPYLNYVFELGSDSEIINNLSDYKVNIDLLDTQLGNSYCGRKNNLGLNFDGLEISIKNIYERYLNEKFIN
jgi:hypothetical protein